MKKVIALLTVLIFVFSSLTVYAADGKVTYSGNAGNFVFKPGSKDSLTDLFADFKNVMPGDSITQKITVKNNADNKVKVKIYIRSLGAQEDSVEFLSKLGLKVAKSEENEMEYMFDAAANETAQFTDWVYLGVLYAGGEVNLDVILDVPVELENEFQNKIGYLDWEFMVEEFPVEAGDPRPPQTGYYSDFALWLTVLITSASLLFVLLLWRKKQDKEKEKTP